MENENCKRTDMTEGKWEEEIKNRKKEERKQGKAEKQEKGQGNMKGHAMQANRW